MTTKTVVIFNDSYRKYDNLAWYNAAGSVIPIVNIITTGKGKNKRMFDFEIECIRDLDKQLGGKLNVYWDANLNNILKDLAPTHIYYNVVPNKPPPCTLKQAKGFDFDYSLLNYGNFERPYKVYSNFVSTHKKKIIPSTYYKSKTKFVQDNGATKDKRFVNYVGVQGNHIQGGRQNALKILSSIKSRTSFASYETERNLVNIPTTHLSAYLNFGCISIREAADAMKQNKSLLAELLWREFYNQIYFFYPELGKGRPFYENRDHKHWNEDPALLAHWKNGTTGVPIVDAAMRALKKTGYLHNRCRMIVASYLVKDMGIDWRLGESYFASQLLDFYFPSNNGGWQYISGTGPSSMMQSRKFNPYLQSQKYDPEAKYIKKYIPELAGVPVKDIQSWDTSFKKWKGTYLAPIL